MKFFGCYCEARKEDFVKDPHSMGAQRSPDRHSDHVSTAERGHLDLAKGVKFDSSFNVLQSFHVTSGLPPCIAYDILEGIGPFDLSLVVRYLVHERK